MLASTGFHQNVNPQVPGDILISVSGNVISRGETCIEVAKKISAAGRPLTLELLRAAGRTLHGNESKAILLENTEGNDRNTTVEEIADGLLSFRTAGIVLAINGGGGQDDEWIRMSVCSPVSC